MKVLHCVVLLTVPLSAVGSTPFAVGSPSIVPGVYAVSFGTVVGYGIFTQVSGIWTPQAPYSGQAIYGNTMVSGGAGSADVYVRNGSGVWSHQAVLTPSVADPQFGSSVAISGNTIVVGGTGKSYAFVRTGTSWSQQATFNTGSIVSISGETIAIGNPNDLGNPNETSPGAVYMYMRTGTTWNLQARLRSILSPTFGPYFTNFGSAVSVSGNSVLIGAPNESNGPVVGAAYVFVRNGSWSLQAHLLPPPQTQNDVLLAGTSVALDGDNAVVGAPGQGGCCQNPYETSGEGAVEVYTRTGSTWSFVQQVILYPQYFTQGFGTHVSLSGNILIADQFVFSPISNTAPVMTPYFVPITQGPPQTTFVFQASDNEDPPEALTVKVLSAPNGIGISNFMPAGPVPNLYPGAPPGLYYFTARIEASCKAPSSGTIMASVIDTQGASVTGSIPFVVQPGQTPCAP